MIQVFITMMTIILCLTAPTTAVFAKNMNLGQVVKSVLSHHPDLKVGQFDIAIAQTETRSVDGQLDPTVTATISASDEKTPVSSDFQASEARTGQLSATISKPLANGGTLGANYTYTRTGQGFVSPLAGQLSKFNPAYRSQISLNYRHPLFRGAKRPDYHEARKAALAHFEAAQHQQQVIAHTLSLQALTAYYQLASDDINIRNAEQAVARARKLLSYQRSREQFGLIERADRLQAEALLAARKTDFQQATARRISDQSTINRLMLEPSDMPLTITVTDQTLEIIPSMRDAMQIAESKRPELRLLKAQQEAASAQLTLLQDADHPQLDVVTELGTRSLSGAPGTALASGMSIKDRFVSLTLEFSDVVNRNSARAAIIKAELEYERISADRERILEQIKDDLAIALTAARTSRPTLILAIQQAEAEKKKFTAEMQRYREGRSDTATLVQFEGELRNAELNAELQQLTLQLAIRQLSWAQGILLHDLGLLATTMESSKP